MLAAVLSVVGVLAVSAGPPAFARPDPGEPVPSVEVTRGTQPVVARQVAELDLLVAGTSAAAEPGQRMGVLRFERQAVRDAAAAEDLDA